MKQWLYLNLMHGWAWLIILEYNIPEGIYILFKLSKIKNSILEKPNGIQNPNGKALILLATFLIYLCKQQIDHPTI